MAVFKVNVYAYFNIKSRNPIPLGGVSSLIALANNQVLDKKEIRGDELYS